MDLLTDPAILAEIGRAWAESRADDPTDRHEEGGYVVVNSDLSYGVERWARGDRSRIVPPPLDAAGCYNGKQVVAAFHTHPNPPLDKMEREWEQGPSEGDRRWHARRKLPGLVVGRVFVYQIDVNAGSKMIGRREDLL